MHIINPINTNDSACKSVEKLQAWSIIKGLLLSQRVTTQENSKQSDGDKER
jgi:hypothetical protein